MKNLVLKTVVLTFIAVIAVFLTVYGCFASFAPKSLASVWADLGNYGISIKYYEKQYEKTDNIDDLATLCSKTDEKNDSERAVKYLALLTEKEDFSEFCAQNDGGKTYEFYYGKYAVAAFYKADVEAAIKVAKLAVKNGYTAHNAFYTLIVSADALTKADGTAIAAAVTEIKSNLTDEKQIGYAERDIKLADEIK